MSCGADIAEVKVEGPIQHGRGFDTRFHEDSCQMLLNLILRNGLSQQPVSFCEAFGGRKASKKNNQLRREAFGGLEMGLQTSTRQLQAQSILKSPNVKAPSP